MVLTRISAFAAVLSLKFCHPLCVLVVVQLLSCIWLSATPRTAACQVSLSLTISWSSLHLVSVESVTLSNHFTLCHPLFLPSVFPSIRVFSNEWAFAAKEQTVPWSEVIDTRPSGCLGDTLTCRRPAPPSSAWCLVKWSTQRFLLCSNPLETSSRIGVFWAFRCICVCNFIWLALKLWELLLLVFAFFLDPFPWAFLLDAELVKWWLL